MTVMTLHGEFAAMRARFHRALAVSIVAHTALVAGLVLLHGNRTVSPSIIEVSWLESAFAPIAPIAEPTAVPADRPVAARPRPALPARIGPAAADRDAQLAKLAASRTNLARELEVAPASSATSARLATAPVAGADLRRMAAATMMPVTGNGRPVALARGPQIKASQLALNRGPALAAGGLHLAGEGESGTRANAAAQPAAAPAGRGGDVADDILLEGPAAERPVVSRVLPGYPDWARKQAVETAVTLRFTVLPDGRVREDVQVVRTGGFRDFDAQAVAALRSWLFAPLTGGDAGGQWGTITFRFRLRG